MGTAAQIVAQLRLTAAASHDRAMANEFQTADAFEKSTISRLIGLGTSFALRALVSFQRR
jgi:hypothetical protein